MPHSFRLKLPFEVELAYVHRLEVMLSPGYLRSTLMLPASPHTCMRTGPELRIVLTSGHLHTTHHTDGFSESRLVQQTAPTVLVRCYMSCLLLLIIALLQWFPCRCSFSCSRLWAALVAYPPRQLLAVDQSRPLGATPQNTGPSTCLIAPGSANQRSWGSLGHSPQHLLLQLLRQPLLDGAGLPPSLLSGLPGHRRCLPHQRSGPEAPWAARRELLLQGSLKGSLKGREVHQLMGREMQLVWAAMES